MNLFRASCLLYNGIDQMKAGDQLDQASIVKRCQEGDFEAFEALYHLHSQQALKTAYLLHDRKGIVEDIVPAQGKNRVSIGNAWGQWHEFLLPEYPLIQENGVGGGDISQKPVNVRVTHCLSWEWKGLSYYLYFYKDKELSLEESIKVAESFMAGQK